MKKFSLLLGLLALSSLGSFAQSPGGVSTNLTLWLKADNASATAGSPVQQWTTSGGSATGYTISQSNAANSPTLVNGATNSAQFNYNPSVQFSVAAKTQLFSTASTPSLLGSNGTAIVVASQPGDTGTAFSYFSYGNLGRYQLKPSWRFQSASNGWGYTFDWSAPTEYPTTAASILAIYGAGSTSALRKNSVLTTTFSNSGSTYMPNINYGLYLGTNNTVQYLPEYTNSNVAEVILFNAKPSAADMDRVETYLSIKYGITRGGNTNTSSAYNYIASDGTIIWNKMTNSAYNNDIAGIGRDDNSGLVQKQSISVNNGEVLTIALGNTNISTENATNTNSFLGNISFLTWANNGLANAFDATASKPAGISGRLNRVWETQATNFSQQATFGFDTTQITGIGAMETLCLLFDDDGVDLSNATLVAASTGTNPTGSRIEFSGINIPVGKPYFTLAMRSSTPVFDDVTMIGSTVTFPTTSANGFTGTWSPAQMIEGDNTYTFTPNAGQNATTATMSFLYLNQQAIDAEDDDFSATPISTRMGGSTPSVFDNDSIIFGDAVSSNNVNYTYSVSPNYYLIQLNSDGTISVPSGTPDGTYTVTYTISGKNCSAKSATATATIIVGEPNTGRKLAKELTQTITAYPNPSSGIFNIDLRESSGDYSNVTVFNVLGETVYTGNVTPKTWNLINISNAASGIYIAKVSGNSGSSSFQLIKQ